MISTDRVLLQGQLMVKPDWKEEIQTGGALHHPADSKHKVQEIYMLNHTLHRFSQSALESLFYEIASP